MPNPLSPHFTTNPGSIWIMGLSASGKTTLSGMLADRIRESGYPCMLLDGDQIRGIFEERLGYDPESRRQQTRRVLGLTRWISSQGILPVVAIIHPFEDDRIECRKQLGKYFEIFLQCGLEECIRRDQKDVYRPVLDGKAEHVVGLDIPFDPPQHSDLVIETDKMSPDESLEIIWERVRDEMLPDYQIRLVGGEAD